VRAVFEDTYNYMKNGTLFRQVINEINKIDFNKSGDRHVFNDIYETILKELQSAGSSGEYYTPRAVTQFMVDIIHPKLGELARPAEPAASLRAALTNCASKPKRHRNSMPCNTPSKALKKSRCRTCCAPPT